MKPKYITVHCSATENMPSVNVTTIRQWHLNRGWRDIGYHFIITTDGTLHEGRPLTMQGAHVGGHNGDNIGICIVGGVDSSGKSVMNFNTKQLNTLQVVVSMLASLHDIPSNNIKGHRDWSKDLNQDGVISKYEWMKDCPCLDVRHFLDTGNAVFMNEERNV